MLCRNVALVQSLSTLAPLSIDFISTLCVYDHFMEFYARRNCERFISCSNSDLLSANFMHAEYCEIVNEADVIAMLAGEQRCSRAPSRISDVNSEMICMSKDDRSAKKKDLLVKTLLLV
jgi:hypothetical protein